MNFARSCASCVGASRTSLPARPRVTPAARSFTAFSASNPAFKKHAKATEQFEDEFEEDFIDDVDSALEQAEAGVTIGGAAGGRAARYSQTLARVDAITSLSSYGLKTSTPSGSVLTSLVSDSDAETLPRTLESIARWRIKNLPLLSDRAVAMLAKRLSESDGPTALAAVSVLADRAKYGIEINDVQALYPLFARLSKPEPLVVAAENETEAAAPSLPSPLAQQAQVCFDLLTLAQQHAPESVSTDHFAHLSTLAITLQSTRTPSSPRIESLIAHLQSIGEDFILQEASTRMGKSMRQVTRYRAMRTTELLRKKQHAELEWFAHLTERLVALTR